ncbi:hypothetical protein SDC9_186482 [bioreactor metagenome]|uniref:Uncharacterized protein n=1 Tax=bioreactor metagenome TaxID=1076179 RepID=A0A645HJ12_9ZZZZ
MDIVRTLFVESNTRFTGVAGLVFVRRIQTIDRLGKDAGTGSLTHTTWPTEQIGMCQLAACDGIF